jgi:hypothetical protein
MPCLNLAEFGQKQTIGPFDSRQEAAPSSQQIMSSGQRLKGTVQQRNATIEK